MKFTEIEKETKVHPGEYLLHEPTKQIVLCGSFSRKHNRIRVMGNGRIFEDKILNFKKIATTAEERRKRRYSRCKGCRQ